MTRFKSHSRGLIFVRVSVVATVTIFLLAINNLTGSLRTLRLLLTLSRSSDRLGKSSTVILELHQDRSTTKLVRKAEERIKELKHDAVSSPLESAAVAPAATSSLFFRNNLTRQVQNHTTMTTTNSKLEASDENKLPSFIPLPEMPLLKTTEKITTHIEQSPKTPRFVFQMHIPKTGGRTFREKVRHFVNIKNGPWDCPLNVCCSPWEQYMQSLLNSSLTNPHHPCRCFAREITLPGIFETRRQLKMQDYQNNWWYTATLFQNPLVRFVSAAKHNMRAGRCSIYDLAQSVSAKLNGACLPVGHDREQAQYFYVDKSNSVLNLTSSDPWVPEQSLTVDDPWKHVSAIDFVGITGYMDASTCLLALRLAELRYTTFPIAFSRACSNNPNYWIQNTEMNEVALSPLTTKQVVAILRDLHPVDAQIYPRLLGQFREKLIQSLSIHNPALLAKYQADLVRLAADQAVWTTVARWLRDYQHDEATLIHLFDKMDHKHILAPNLAWHQSASN